MKTALLAVLLFGIMIYPHELGHFLAAKLVGVKVNEFAFGMGPTIWKKQRGETLHSIRLFPVGGFCAMEGEDENSEDPRAFGRKKPWQKLVVTAAGSFMNMLCAVLIMSLVIGVMGFTTTTIGEVLEDMPAQKAGIMTEDKILKVDGTPIEQWVDVSTALQKKGGEAVEVEIERGSEIQTITLTPEMSETVDAAGNKVKGYMVGFTCKVSHNPFKALVSGVQSTWNINKMMFVSLKQLFTGEVGIDSMSGPVGMIEMVNESTQYGFWYYGFLAALVCVNLAIINMLPFPALDGGRIIFILYSMITGRKVNTKVEGFIHIVGMALLFGLMIYVTMNDVMRIFG